MWSPARGWIRRMRKKLGLTLLETLKSFMFVSLTKGVFVSLTKGVFVDPRRGEDSRLRIWVESVLAHTQILYGELRVREQGNGNVRLVGLMGQLNQNLFGWGTGRVSAAFLPVSVNDQLCGRYLGNYDF